MVSGGIVTLLGIIFTQYRIERAGIHLLGATVGIFSFALLDDLPSTFMILTIFVFFQLALFGRYWVLGKLLLIENTRVRIELERQRNEN